MNDAYSLILGILSLGIFGMTQFTPFGDQLISLVFIFQEVHLLMYID